MHNGRVDWWLIVGLLCLAARPAVAIPSDDLLRSLEPTADVNDFAGLLSPAEKETLEARCRQLRERTGAQLAVVTLQSLRGGEIDDFTNKLFARWGVGQKEKKNGVMLLVSMEERRSRIEVGYGLEPIIPDALAGRILDHQLKPPFRQQHYAAGLEAAVNQICELIEKGEPAGRHAIRGNGGRFSAGTLLLVLFLTLFVAIGGFVFGAGVGAKELAGVFFGAFFAGIPMLMGLAAAGPLSLLLHVPAAIMMAVIGWNVARQGPPRRRGRAVRRPAEPTIWTWGSPSGTGGGWTTGGGGFSQGWGGFGGGSSGGGGASGSW